jgi:hypothetical protein
MDDSPQKSKDGRQVDAAEPEITTLTRREIQAPLIAGLIRGFIHLSGYAKVMEVVSLVIEEDAVAAGKRMAENYKGNSMKEMVRILKEVWAEEDALEYTILEQTDQRFSFDVTRCRYAELYERLGIRSFGCVLSCNRDEPFITSFNSRMKLIRTQTIMQGASVCDFRIVLE